MEPLMDRIVRRIGERAFLLGDTAERMQMAQAARLGRGIARRAGDPVRP